MNGYSGIKSQLFADKLYWVIAKSALLVYYIAFIYASYKFYLICQDMHHLWIFVNILNGIMGGIIFVYPITAIKNGVLQNDILWRFIFFYLFRINWNNFINQHRFRY